MMYRSSTIGQLFSMQSAIKRHSAAPLLKEREAYLQHLLQRGNTWAGVRFAAIYLLHVLRVLRLAKLRLVSDAEIKATALLWAGERFEHRKHRPSSKSIMAFATAARGFLRFLGKFMPSQPLSCCYDSLISEFLLYQQAGGYATTTIACTTGPIRGFLFWVAGRKQRLLSVRPDDIAIYLREGLRRGWRICTIVSYSRALRTFFRFAEKRGWCKPGISETIRSPVISRQDWEVIGPPWKEVRRMIAGVVDTNAYGSRAKAILLLCSVYGLRSAEVVRLRLEDFDWQAETFAVKRAKQGSWQRFPLRPEVGEAIIQYIRIGRAQSESRNLFLTMVPPFGPMKSLTSTVQKQMRSADVVSQHYGPHSLRHSCGTELLRQGTSLQQIAAFLGHRDIRSVSVYAKFDVRSLRRVADFSLSGVL